MIRQKRGFGISALYAAQMFFSPVSSVAYSNIADVLQPQPLFSNRDGHPQCTLIVFKPITADPRCFARKLHIVKDDKNVGDLHLVEEAWIGSKIGLVGRYDHVSTWGCRNSKHCQNLKKMQQLRH